MPTFELIVTVKRDVHIKDGYSKEETSTLLSALKSAKIQWDIPEEFPYVASIDEALVVVPTSYLETHYFDINELRMFLAEISKAGTKRISVMNLLIYIKTIATQEVD